MDLRDKYLWDISMAIDKINGFVSSYGLRFDIFKENPLYQDAIQWNIMIIGEAMGQLLKIDPTLPISNARRIVDCRNFLVHSYDSLSAEIIWAIVVKDIPLLRREISDLMT